MPPPISRHTTPSSFWRFERVALLDARASSVISSTSMPISFNTLIKFFIYIEAPLITSESTSNLTPRMPSGSFMPPSPSTINSLGITCIISLLFGKAKVLASEITRSISSADISPSARDTAITPLLGTAEICLPPILTTARLIFTAETLSAVLTDSDMAALASSESTITPWRIPEDLAKPTPIIWGKRSSFFRATIV